MRRFRQVEVSRGCDDKYRGWVQFSQSDLGIPTQVEYQGVMRQGYDHDIWCIVCVRTREVDAFREALEISRRG